MHPGQFAFVISLATVAACGSPPAGGMSPGARPDASTAGADASGASSSATSSARGSTGSSSSGESGVDAAADDASPNEAVVESGSDANSMPADNDASAGDSSGIPITPACPAPVGAPVTLTATGGNIVVSNGLVTITFDGAGHVTQVAKGGTNLMTGGDTMYVSESGGANYYAIGASSHTVVQQTADAVELSFVDTSGASHDMDWDLHYVVRRGVSGFYYFRVTKVGTSTHPSPTSLSELRTVQRFDPAILANAYNGERHGQLPTAAQNATFSPATQIEDATYPLTVAPTALPGASSRPGVVGQHYDEGPVYSKYDWATYRVEDLRHGLYGGGFGAWMISPSWEYYTGGPVKQELMVHHDNLLLNMYHGGHFGSAIGAASPPNWQKLYGPNLVYINAGAGRAVLADAAAQAGQERGQWPYCWMNHPLYPLSGQRGTVKGQLVEAHGRSVDGAVVTLAQPGELIAQGYDYMFWSSADSSGNFTIPAVRPGTYAVHVYATQGTIIDDPTHGEIVATATVKAGPNDLGTLTWTPPYHAHLLWAIGVSDQRSGEFRFDPKVAASPDNTAYRTGRMFGPSAAAGVWTVAPASTTYTVGTSTPQTDWYSVQSVDGTWSVHFELTTVPTGGAFLTIALAGAARNPSLTAAVNGHALVNVALGNDQSLYRAALEGGRFQMLTAAVPAAALVTGANTASFTVNTRGNAGSGVFYDIVELESD